LYGTYTRRVKGGDRVIVFRGWRRVLMLSTRALPLLLAFCAACINTPGANAPLISHSPSPKASVEEKIVALGRSVETTAGNKVTAYAFLPSIGRAPGQDMIYVAADVEACAGPKAPSQTGVNRSLFAVETPDSTGWPSRDPVKEPALKATYIAPNHCTRGWVTFSIPKSAKPLFVVLLSSAVVKWRIP